MNTNVDIEGLRRKLSRKLSIDESCDEAEWEVSEISIRQLNLSPFRLHFKWLTSCM